MNTFQATMVLLALALLSGSALALPSQTTATPVDKHHSCYTYTVTTPFTGIINCPLQTPCGPVPDCIILSKTTLSVPCANKKCPKTPTVTVTAPGVCPTCRKGCGTNVVTEMATTGCSKTTAS